MNWTKVPEKLTKPICINGVSSNLCSSILKKDCKCKIYEDAVKNALTQDTGEVMAFHPDWVDADFNPDGIRVGFVNGDGNFYSAEWNDYQDTYQNSEHHFPTHYMKKPASPKL